MIWNMYVWQMKREGMIFCSSIYIYVGTHRGAGAGSVAHVFICRRYWSALPYRRKHTNICWISKKIMRRCCSSWGSKRSSFKKNFRMWNIVEKLRFPGRGRCSDRVWLQLCGNQTLLLLFPSDLQMVERKQRLQAQQQRHDASKEQLNQMQKSFTAVHAGVEHLAGRLHHMELVNGTANIPAKFQRWHFFLCQSVRENVCSWWSSCLFTFFSR